jgi:hypothetical protein
MNLNINYVTIIIMEEATKRKYYENMYQIANEYYKKKYNIVIKENNDNSLNKNIDYKIVNNPDKKINIIISLAFLILYYVTHL